MKKNLLYILIITVAVLTALFGPAMVAHAEGEIDVSVRVSPTSVYGPQNVNPTINISAGDQALVATLYKGSTKLADYTLAPNETKTYTDPISVSEAELGDNKLVFKVNYSVGGGPTQTITKTVSVLKMAPKKSMEKTFTTDRDYVPAGEQIGFLFKFVNTGSKTISNLRVRDDALGNNAWLGPVTLEAGETKIITYNLSLNHDTSVKPQVRYEVDGQEYNESFGEKTLRVVDDDVSLSLEASTLKPAAGEPVTFTVRMRNNGNIYLRNLKLYNHNNELVRLSGTVLRAGESISVTTDVIFTESRSVQFDITATDVYGSVYSHASNELEISVPIEFNDEDLTVTAEADYHNLPEPGDASFNVLLTNNSPYGLDDIRILDASTGEEVGTITHMEKGERLVRVATEITASRDVVFKVEAFDADDNMHTADTSTEPIAITILSQAAEEEAAEEATPEPTATPEPVPASFFERISIWMIVLIVSGVLILGVIIAMSMLIAKEKSKMKGTSAPAPKASKAPKKEVFESAASVPKNRPKAPKKKKKPKKKGPIRVSYRDRNTF